ncbi:WDR92-like protein, partial [Mya arenaria]
MSIFSSSVKSGSPICWCLKCALDKATLASMFTLTDESVDTAPDEVSDGHCLSSKTLESSSVIIFVSEHASPMSIFSTAELSHTSPVPSLSCIAEKSKAFKCGTFGASSLQQRFLATGDFDGKMAIWNLEALEVPVYSVKGHSEIINCIDGVGGLGIGEGAPEIVTGSRDGSVKVWDPRQKNDPVATMEPGEGETKRDCWTVAFGNAYTPHERCVCAGYDNGDIKLFDLKTMSLRWETNVKNGVCHMEFDRKDINMNKLVATTLESKFHVYDTRTQHPTKGFASVTEKKFSNTDCKNAMIFQAHKSTVWQAKHLPQNRDVNYPASRVAKDNDEVEMGVAGTLQLVQNTVLSTQPISSFDWSPDKEGLCVCTSFDQMLRVLVVTRLKSSAKLLFIVFMVVKLNPIKIKHILVDLLFFRSLMQFV